MPDTTKATEARKQKALAKKTADDKAIARTQAELDVLKRYGEFLPANSIDPVGVYNLWKKSIFAELPEGIQADDTIMYFVVSQARAAGIDPRVPKQIYALPYKNKKTGIVSWTVITGVEGMVTIAERTGMFGGFTKPEYEFGLCKDEESFGDTDRNIIISCTIGAIKVVQGVPITSYATVYFDEYDTGKNLWEPAGLQTRSGQNGEYKVQGGKPKTMLAKVAKVQALRQTFSACAGLYIAEEIDTHPDAIDGELVVPDLKDAIDNAGDAAALQEILSKLTIDDKKRAAPLISAKLKELSK